MLPNFFIIGAQKAGTSSLYNYLKSHPQIFMSEDKEPQYFATARNWSRGQDWYESLFDDAGNATAIGEASTVYSKHPVHHDVPERIAGLIPEARLIYLVRHPVERIRSHYEHLHKLGLANGIGPLAVEALEDPKYVNYSRYAYQIDQYLKCFPREQLLVVTTEDMRDDRVATLSRIFGFLGVDTAWVPPKVAKEHGATRNRQTRPLARKLKRLPGYRFGARLAPAGVKAAYRKVATRSTYTWIAPDRRREEEGTLQRMTSLPNEVRRELESRLADDVARLRQFLGPRFDGWGISIAAFFLAEPVIEFL
jgi:hypothetical protein